MTEERVEDGIEHTMSEPAQLQDLVLDSADLERFLNRLAVFAAATFSNETREVFCSVTLLRPKSKSIIASSSDQAKNLDEVQLAYDDGPCLRAAREGQIYVVKDFTTDDRFGAYSAAMLSHGIRSALGVPIALDGHAAAGLNLYATAPDSFDPDVMTAADTLGREASQLLRMAVHIAHLTATNHHLTQALSSRTTIDVAAGIIMAQNRCSHDDAMTILKAASSGRNMKLHDVAGAVVASLGQQTPTTHFNP
ncbi:GAF and ANTAR domain-containing protein [Arthrobacter agilis]|uniref:GAF and ANTAR domain-containing protein n=1 Tax=Arthrobacter agilis TaxID=37921 RepID=UPI0027819B01|nr:GAF and ANTAR domain-containing protein [Arthrobacter agilis]MDQ0734749.1 GAF domain-containing protein [Arthrobacter agilis]